MDIAIQQAFVREGFGESLQSLTPGSMAVWGKMNAQQMVEHVTGFFRVSTNQLHFPLVTPEADLPKFKAFLLSDKMFRENTKAPVLPEEPLPTRLPDLPSAVAELQQAILHFFHFFEQDPLQTTQHPVFGDLNYEEWIRLHYKHVMHHARQFSLI
ncbi:MAG: DUF1569 domain-containing protein [Chitinophagaceae bacterium]|nr:DUF1569 domain-containing protein [Chitinophagaceae bacterium]